MLEDDIRGYKALINAVILRAVYDCFGMPIDKDKKLTAMARSAFEFIMSKDVEVYLSLIDIDHDYFRRKLLETMFDKANVTPTMFNEESLTNSRKRLFRINYKLWQQEKAKKRVYI